MKSQLTFVSVVAAMLLAACAGHNAATLPPRPASKQTAPVQFTIRVPKAGAVVTGVRHRQYISPATQSVAINAQAFNVTPASTNCSTQSSTLTCTFTVDAPNLGQAVFTVSTYDQPLDANGQVQGNELSTGSTSANIVAGTANTVKVTTNGVPASATFSIANLTPPMGTAVTIPITFNVVDADGYAIVGTFSSALVIAPATSGSGPSFLVNGTAGGEAYITSSSDTAAIAYSGHNVAKSTITGSINGTTLSPSVTFDPQPAFGAETAVNTPLNNAQAYRDTGAPVTTYFTEPAKNGFGTIVGSGSIVEYVTPSGGTPGHLTHSFFPEGVTFTENNDAIGSIGYSNGQITISDTVQSITANAGLYEFAQWGLSGTEGFTEYNVGKIGEIVNEGDPLAGGKGFVTTEIATGVAGSTPAGIQPTSSGFIFADPGANSIAILSSSNAFTYLPVPSSGAHPTDIVTDQNGNFWFTEPGVNKVGKIDSSNAITEYPCGGSPIAIVGQYQTLAVLTSAGNIDIYSVSDGSYTQYTPPTSSAGQVVGIGDGGLGDIIVLRSNGSTGAIQDFYYQ